MDDNVKYVTLEQFERVMKAFALELVKRPVIDDNNQSKTATYSSDKIQNM